MRWLDGITNAMGMNWKNFGDGEGQGGLVMPEFYQKKNGYSTFIF